MAGIIKADTIYGESSLRLNVGEVTLINVNATAFNVAQPLNVQTNATITGNLTVLGNMTVDGTQFVTNTEILVVEDKNIEIANVATPQQRQLMVQVSQFAQVLLLQVIEIHLFNGNFQTNHS